MVQKFRKKPVVIEAQLLEYTIENRNQIAEWCKGIVDEHHSGISIPTLEGIMYAQVGDYIIKGVNGEFYPCKPDIFEKTYDPVNNLEEEMKQLCENFEYRYNLNSFSDDTYRCTVGLKKWTGIQIEHHGLIVHATSKDDALQSAIDWIKTHPIK